MIRGVVFDFDGTLVDSNHIKRETFFELASEFEDGVRLMEKAMKEANGRDRYWVFARFAAALPGLANAEALAHRYTRTCQERIAGAPEIAGAEACLEGLREEGKLLFVNSATPAEPLARLIQLRRMEKWFAGIYGAPAEKHENLSSIRSKHGLAADEILVVGDGESDRLAAEMHGCHFVAVENPENDFKQQPTCRIPDLTELPAAIASIQL